MNITFENPPDGLLCPVHQVPIKKWIDTGARSMVCFFREVDDQGRQHHHDMNYGSFLYRCEAGHLGEARYMGYGCECGWKAYQHPYGACPESPYFLPGELDPWFLKKFGDQLREEA